MVLVAEGRGKGAYSFKRGGGRCKKKRRGHEHPVGGYSVLCRLRKGREPKRKKPMGTVRSKSKQKLTKNRFRHGRDEKE